MSNFITTSVLGGPRKLTLGKTITRHAFCRSQSTLHLSSNISNQTVNDVASKRSKPNPGLNCGSTYLARMPTSSILRALVLGSLFTSPILMRPALWAAQKIANSSSRILNPDVNPLLRIIMKPLFYDQFCAGTTRSEICKTRDQIKSMGYAGIVLCYGKEIQVSSSNEMHSTGTQVFDKRSEIDQWKIGNLDTLDMIAEGDWVGIKYTGAGPVVTDALMKNSDPPQEFVEAMDAICQKAKEQNCRIWIDAEQQVLQTAIDKWTIDLMRKYNRNGESLIYNTVQAYLKASRSKLQEQLTLADREGWTLAVKLVRGAYINNDLREKIHDTKKETDESYDSIVRDLLLGTNLGFAEGRLPKMHLLIAGHNPQSVTAASNLIQSLSEQGKLSLIPEFGQLQGMADELGCKLLQHHENLEKEKRSDLQTQVVPKVYKCLTWGTIHECTQYLLRRAVENSGGTDRMRDGMAEYFSELKRRMRLSR